MASSIGSTASNFAMVTSELSNPTAEIDSNTFKKNVAAAQEMTEHCEPS
jgi:hypothetical protein